MPVAWAVLLRGQTEPPADAYNRGLMDCNITELIVILDKAWENNLAGATEMLKGVGMRITNADDDNSVVEGEIDSEHLHALERLPCVDYIRKVFSYDANFPPGDPRDRDGI